MPEIQFKAIIFSMACAIILSTVALLSLKRSIRVWRKKFNPPEAFLVWAVLFVLGYFINRLVFPDRLKTAAVVNLALLFFLLALPKLKVKLRRLRHKARRHPHFGIDFTALKRMFQVDPRHKAVSHPHLMVELTALKRMFQADPRHKAVRHPHLMVEITALKRMIHIDPLNAFCFERLSELYEKMGEHDSALRFAREAVRLDPSLVNKQRLEELQRKDPN